MLTHMKRSYAGLAVLCLLAAMPLIYACDKVPLLAPTGSVISVFASANTVPLNGDIEIVANVIENGTTQTPTTPTPGTPTNGTPTTGTTGTTSTTSAGAGTPVQNGTLVSFTTTIGRIQPSEARTSNGQVRVRFFAGAQSGTATITAFSGGASGKLENLKVGAAAVDHFTVSANPQTLGPAGGTSTITAHVEDESGAAVGGVNVTFSTDNGSVNPGNAATDASGNASTTLTTPRTAKVTVTVAGKDPKDITVGLNPRTGVNISSSGQTSVGLPVTFTVKVGATANIRNVVVDYGDGVQQPLGAISSDSTVQHTYSEPGTYIVRATATDASDFTEQVSTSVTILPAQAPSVTIQGPQTAKINEAVTFIANVTGTISTIKEFQWDFGEGANPRFVTTTSSRQTTTYTTPGSKSVTVHVVQNIGPAGDGTTVITISLTLR
jgi:Big-like domain-containing protein/PKD domain-containing protein